jgi:hypothetical protein
VVVELLAAASLKTRLIVLRRAGTLAQIDQAMLDPDTSSSSGAPARRLAQTGGIPWGTRRSASSIRPFWIGSRR